MINLELHVHSSYSFDCLSKPDAVVETARNKGYNGVAITDHNVFRVDLSLLQSRFPDMILIPATEIGTTFGDVLAYFIEQEITERDFDKVLKIVRHQGGIAILAHPYQRGRSYPRHVFEKVDGFEAYNAHNKANESRVLDIAQEYGKPVIAGSDAHFLWDIGRGVNKVKITIEDARDNIKLKKAILTSTHAYCTKAPTLSMPLSQGVRLYKKIKSIVSRE